MSEQLRHAGAMLSNCAFNLAQRKPGEPLTEADIRALDDCRRAWDASLSTHHAAPGAPQQDCPNCFEGKSDMDHDCRVCGGTGRAAATAPAGGVTPGAYLRKKAEDYAMEYGSDDMGGLSFGSGAHAEVKMDYYNNLLELAEELDALTAAARAAEPDVDPIQAAADASSVGHLSALLDHQTQLLRRAMAAMKAIEGAASPADEGRGDFTATVPYETWAAFVDARASLLHDVAQSPVADQEARAAEPDSWEAGYRRLEAIIEEIPDDVLNAATDRVINKKRAAAPTPPTGTEKKKDAEPVVHQGMTIAGDGAAMLGRLMREQRASRLGVYPDGNPNAGTEKP